MLDFLKRVALFLPIYLYYVLLERLVGKNWITVAIFVLTLIVGRLALCFYRRSRGIWDEYVD